MTELFAPRLLPAMLIVAVALCGGTAVAATKTQKAPKPFVCAAVPTPVVALTYGSR